jgi:ADP-ribose pyrophosphatase YjhB (NUDIX family)
MEVSKTYSFENSIYTPKETNQNLKILLLKSTDEKSEKNEIIELFLKHNFTVHTDYAMSSKEKLKLQNHSFPILICDLSSHNIEIDLWLNIIKILRTSSQSCFIAVVSSLACDNPLIRTAFFEEGSNMVTYCIYSLENVILKIKNQILSKKNAKLTCPICKMQELTEDTLWVHLPLYHINYHPKLMRQIKSCPLCNKSPSPNLQVHYRNLHGPAARGEVHTEVEEPVNLYAFALVVVRRKEDGKYLLVQEFAQSGYWLPGGRVDNSENLEVAAIRETQEEAGVDINLIGVLTIQFNHPHGRLRVIYYAEPKDKNQKPKSIPDYESVGASWVSPEELNKIPLRGNEPLIWIDYLEKGGQIYPLSVFTRE